MGRIVAEGLFLALLQIFLFPFYSLLFLFPSKACNLSGNDWYLERKRGVSLFLESTNTAFDLVKRCLGQLMFSAWLVVTVLAVS